MHGDPGGLLWGGASGEAPVARRKLLGRRPTGWTLKQLGQMLVLRRSVETPLARGGQGATAIAVKKGKAPLQGFSSFSALVSSMASSSVSWKYGLAPAGIGLFWG